MTVLRFQRDGYHIFQDLRKQLPSGSLTSVSVPEPGQMIDVNVTAGGVTDATNRMTALGYTLFATDPAPTLEQAAVVEMTPVNQVKLTDNTVLTIGAVSDGQILSRSGTNLVGTAPSAFDMRDVLAFDHFITGNTDLDELGLMGWRSFNAGTGSAVSLTTTAGHPGIITLEGGTVLAGRSAINLIGPPGGTFILDTSQNQIDHEWLIRFNTNATSSANHVRTTVGWGDQWEAGDDVEHTNGVYMEFAPGTSANFALVNVNSNSRTRTASSIAVSGNTWYRINIRIRYPGGTPTAELLINGTVRATITTNFPATAVGVGFRIDGTSTGSEATVDADYMLITQVTTKET